MTSKKTRIVYVVLILTALLAAGCTRPSSQPESMIQVGSAAPSFKLPDLGGQEIALDQFKGKVVMLDFWATWCGPCRMTMPLMESLQKEFAGSMVLLAVNVQETKAEVRDYVRAENLRAKVLLDEEGSVGATYGAESIPMQIIIDKQGIIRHIQVGFGAGTAAKLRSEIQRLASL